MAFAAALSVPRWIPQSPSWTHGPLSLCPSKLESKHPRDGCNPYTSLPCVSTVRAKQSSGQRPSAASTEGSMDLPISRREAFLLVGSGAGRSLVATGIALCASASVTDSPAAAAAAGAADTKPRPQFFDLDGSGGVKALDIREGTGAIPHVGDKLDIVFAR